MLASVLRWIALALVLAVAVALRTCDLARRPMHADEANQAVKTGELLETGRYIFDPNDHHGPTLYYFGAAAARARGQRTLAALTESTVRLVPAGFGLLCVTLIAWFVQVATEEPCADRAANSTARGRPIRVTISPEAILAAVFLSVAPAAVYYSRYYVHETLLLGFVWLTLFSAVQSRQTGRIAWTCLAGCAAGCALATKETALLFFASAVIAALVASKSGRDPVPAPSSGRRCRHWLVLATLALCTAAAFYSSFGTHISGIYDALTAPFTGLERATSGGGHDKPWWYYLELLGWQRRGGLLWYQFPLSVLAVIGAIAGWRRWHVRWAAIYAVAVLIALSAVPYKTPWNVIHVLPALALLAAAGVIAIARLKTGPIVAAAFGFLTVTSMLAQSFRVAFKYSADARNPYAYVHSSPDVLKFRPLVEAALTNGGDAPVRVIGPEYWPLPWYLRGLSHIGYWPTPPADCDGKLVIVGAELADEVRGRLHQTYHERYLGLRPGYAMVVFVPEDRTP